MNSVSLSLVFGRVFLFGWLILIAEIFLHLNHSFQCQQQLCQMLKGNSQHQLRPHQALCAGQHIVAQDICTRITKAKHKVLLLDLPLSLALAQGEAVCSLTAKTQAPLQMPLCIRGDSSSCHAQGCAKSSFFFFLHTPPMLSQAAHLQAVPY